MKFKSKSNKRKNQGLAIVEFAAGLSVIFPLSLLMIYIVYEACQFVFINNCLSEAARTGARNCAIAYGAAQGGSIGTADSQGPLVAPPQPSAVYQDPTSTVVQGSSSGSPSTPPRTANDSFALVRIKNVVSDNSQFTATYTPPAPNNQDPSYTIGRVTVTVTYAGSFPQPDPLGIIAKLTNLKLRQSCTYPLEF